MNKNICNLIKTIPFMFCRSDEHLLSEVFLLATSVKNVKKELSLRLPYKQENTELFDIELLWKRVEGDDWATKEFTFSVSVQLLL